MLRITASVKGFLGDRIILIVFFLLLRLESTGSKKFSYPGHLKKLGSHMEPQGVSIIGKFSHPFVFYHQFVDREKPLLMKSALDNVNHPGLTNWTDEYLKEHFGSEFVKVEPRKVEKRGIVDQWMTLRQFLNIYQEQDMYMVHSLNNKMEDLVLIPETLQCGGFQNVLQDAFLWMGSGEMSSVLHRDPLDNLLCLLDGQKDIVLINKAYKELVESHGFDEKDGYSSVDPLAVDMDEFQDFRQLIWHEAKLEKGDCIYIPNHWYHQVNSLGPRHMSINIWFPYISWFDSLNCSISKSYYKKLEPVSTFGFASPNEIYRSKLLRLFKNKGFLTEDRFHELLPNNPTRKRSDEFFHSINDFDPVISWGELYSFDIDKMLMKFPDLFELPSQPSNNAGDDDENDSVGRKDITDEVDDDESDSVGRKDIADDDDESDIVGRKDFSDNDESDIVGSKDITDGDSLGRKDFTDNANSDSVGSKDIADDDDESDIVGRKDFSDNDESDSVGSKDFSDDDSDSVGRKDSSNNDDCDSVSNKDIGDLKWPQEAYLEPDESSTASSEHYTQSASRSDFDDSVPLPDAVSIDDVPLPDDSIGQVLGSDGNLHESNGDGDDDAEADGDLREDYTGGLRKDEL